MFRKNSAMSSSRKPSIGNQYEKLAWPREYTIDVKVKVEQLKSFKF